MSTHATGTRPARDRLLDAASELFYEHGVHTVGIDTIIERAAVAKASLYSAFGSKEELVRAYLEARHASRRATVLAEMELHDDPRGKLLAVFDVLVTTVKQPEFRGCAFANASAESEPDSAAADVTRKVRAWLLGVMAGQATALARRIRPAWRDSSPCCTTEPSPSRGSSVALPPPPRRRRPPKCSSMRPFRPRGSRGRDRPARRAAPAASPPAG